MMRVDSLVLCSLSLVHMHSEAEAAEHCQILVSIFTIQFDAAASVHLISHTLSVEFREGGQGPRRLGWEEVGARMTAANVIHQPLTASVVSRSRWLIFRNDGLNVALCTRV